MNARQIAGLVASGRIAAGVALALTPGLVTRRWVGDDSTSVPVVAAGFGARDIAIGAGTLRALASGGPAQEWLLAGAFTDAGDLLATFAGRRSLPPLGAAGTCLLAGSGVVLGVYAARGLSQPAP